MEVRVRLLRSSGTGVTERSRFPGLERSIRSRGASQRPLVPVDQMALPFW